MASTVGVVCVRKVPPCIQNLGPGAKKEPQSCVGGRLVRSFLLCTSFPCRGRDVKYNEG